MDACAIIAIFKGEQGEDKVRALFDEALAGRSQIFMNIINLLEVHYGFFRELGAEKSDLILKKIRTLPIHFVDTIDATIFSEASRLKASYLIPLGDAIGLATAVRMNSTFVTADHSDFDKIERTETISFLWFR